MARAPTGREPAERDGGVVERAPLNGNRHTRSTVDGLGERVDFPITGMTCAACARRMRMARSQTGAGRSSQRAQRHRDR